MMPYIYNPTSKTYVALCRTEGGLSNDDNFTKYLPYFFIFHIKRIAIPPLRLMASFLLALPVYLLRVYHFTTAVYRSSARTRLQMSVHMPSPTTTLIVVSTRSR